MEENKVYKCPKCQNNSVHETDYGGYKEYRCQSCGYNYQIPQQKKKNPMMDFFKLLEKSAWLLSVIAIVLAVAMLPIIGGQVDSANSRINTVSYNFNNLDDKVDNNNDSLASIKTDITGMKFNIDSMDVLINAIETNIGNLIGLDSVVSKLKTNVTNLEDNLSEFENDINQLFTLVGTNPLDSDVNLTFTFYKNQTNVTNYCHLDFTVENTDTDIGDVKFGFQYDKTNVSLMNWTGNIKPQEYQWVNGIYNDNYLLHWFERGNTFSARYNITWSYNDYNSTQLDTDDIKENLMVNGFLIDDIDVWVEEL